ncbi:MULTISPECIES: GGDEF domain-containing protein [Actinoplanes]|uniref:tetratricopeptide repeat-containing diguanylate cyclase n=1 Tax=Actinoplanes TaxID=1865 RepID=UPI0012F85EB6|nr:MULTISPECIES: GGDEF domain-containing protein [Actinoplanes]GLX99650.1 hypothetical protein Acsp01_00300 [Actinoplanes sp. NBRC 101535]
MLPVVEDSLLGAVGRLVADVYASHVGLAERAAALAGAAERAGDGQCVLLARLVAAELDNRAGRAPEGVTVARHVLSSSEDRLVRAHAHAVIAGGLWRLGDNATAVRHALWATRMLADGDPLPLRADHAIILAVQVNDRRLGDFSAEEFVVAQELADASGLPTLIIANLNNWAWCSYAAGDIDAAGELTGRLRDFAAASGQALNASTADTVANVLLETGRAGEAERVIRYAIEHAPSTDSDAVPGALLTLAEIQRRGGDLGTALSTLQRCRVLAAERHLPENDAQALRMIASCHAEAGDFAAAYRSMVEFHEAWEGRRTQQGDMAARFAHAQFAVEEAYRASEHFREMAERDSLTGLWNRRRSDAVLAEVLASGEPASVALVDLDHFKRVNDTFSHAVGDEVLRRLADLLNGVPGHAGRLGGEEFVLILRAGPDEAARMCELLRAEIEAYGWGDIVAGLRVTASIGVTGVLPGDDRGVVVGRADALLYDAKHAGRNRVTTG